MRKLLCAVLCVAIAGCGMPFYVATEPGHADLYVDGKYVGTGAARVSTNGIVFNSYHIEARDQAGNVLNTAEVDVSFGARSAICAGIGLVGIVVWPLLAFIPASFFVGDPSPEHIYLHVPSPQPPPVERETIDRPVLEITAPVQGDQLTAPEVRVKGRARHWSGIASLSFELDGRAIRQLAPPQSEAELRFDEPLTVDASGNHTLTVIAKGVRGAEAREEVRLTRVVPGTPPPAPPSEKVPGLEEPK